MSWAADECPDPAGIDATPIPRTVTARTPRAWDGPEVVAHTDGLIVDAVTGEAVPGAATAAFWTRRRRAPLVIVTDSPAALAAEVEAAGGEWQGNVHRRRGWQPGKGRPSRHETEQSSVTSAKLPGSDRRAVVVCAHLFLDDLPPAPAPARARRLVRFALDYLDWCREHGWAPRPSRGSWGAAFLRDARFWPAARRKVPRIFNRIAREHLPGNHYERMSDEPGAAAAAEVDMSGAHHQSAQRARFPQADRMTKAGAWRRERRTGAGPEHGNWPAAQRVLGRPGMFRLRMSFPALADDEVAPPWWPRAGGEAVVVVWSPELPDAIARGARVLAVVASITSADECDGLARYAAWAQAELAAAGEYRRTWLKGTLLAAYGVLAQGARAPAVVSSRPTRRSTPMPVVIAGSLVNAHVAVSWRAVEPGYVNAIARGIVEAETRAELLRAGDALARGMGRSRMLALYADSVLVGLPVVSGADLDDLAATLAARAGAAMGDRAGGTDRTAETGDGNADPPAILTGRAVAAERLGVPDFLDWYRAHRHPSQRPGSTDFAEWFSRERLPGLVADLLAAAAERRTSRQEAADWRVKQLHLGLAFHVEGSAVHWTSDRADKRPGVPRAGRAPAPRVIRAGEGHWLDDP